MEAENSWEQITIGNSVINGWKSIASDHNLTIQVSGLPALSSFNFDKYHLESKTLLTQEMLKQAIYSTNFMLQRCIKVI